MRRLALPLVIACALCTLAAPAFAQAGSLAPSQPPAIGQDTPQAVRPAIVGQARPTAPSPTPRASEAPPERLGTSSPAAFDDVPNVRVEVTITYQVGQGAAVRRSASLVVASSQDNGSLRSGNQIPVPSTTFVPIGQQPKPDGYTVAPAAGNPMTSYTYRAVGFNLDARRVRVSGNRTKLDLVIEFSAIDDRAADGAKAGGTNYPSFPTFSQSMAIVLESGKPVVVAQANDVVDNVARKQSVEVVATILR